MQRIFRIETAIASNSDKAGGLNSEAEMLWGEVLHCKCKNELLEGESHSKKEELTTMAEKHHMIEQKEKENKSVRNKKIKLLEKALKGKNKQLIDHLQRDRGRLQPVAIFAVLEIASL